MLPSGAAVLCTRLYRLQLLLRPAEQQDSLPGNAAEAVQPLVFTEGWSALTQQSSCCAAGSNSSGPDAMQDRQQVVAHQPVPAYPTPLQQSQSP